MTQEELLDAHYYIESLALSEEIKEVCRGIMLGQYWAIKLKASGIDITNIDTRSLIDSVADAHDVPAPRISG